MVVGLIHAALFRPLELTTLKYSCYDGVCPPDCDTAEPWDACSGFIHGNFVAAGSQCVGIGFICAIDQEPPQVVVLPSHRLANHSKPSRTRSGGGFFLKRVEVHVRGTDCGASGLHCRWAIQYESEPDRMSHVAYFV